MISGFPLEIISLSLVEIRWIAGLIRMKGSGFNYYQLLVLVGLNPQFLTCMQCSPTFSEHLLIGGSFPRG